MHTAAYEWVKRFATNDPVKVLDIGGRDINGSCCPLFPAADYTAVDLYAGEGVDVVSDICEWQSDETYDFVLCAEVLEHAPNWREIVRVAFERCREGGTFVMTCAGPGRHEHSGIDGNELKSGEHYANIDPDEFSDVLDALPWSSFMVDVTGLDLRAVAFK